MTDEDHESQKATEIKEGGPMVTTDRSQRDSNKSRKRKRPFADSLSQAYSSVTFRSRKTSSDPDNPGFFFSSSYSVRFSDSREDSVLDIEQVVHKHVNGLCMVTVGDISLSSTQKLKDIRFLAKEAPACSNAAKRKRQAKMLKGKGKVEDAITPSTVIAELVLEDQTDESVTIVPIRACVWGTILELNTTSLSPKVLLEDPLLDGFIAIILPTGNFPPSSSLSS